MQIPGYVVGSARQRWDVDVLWEGGMADYLWIRICMSNEDLSDFEILQRRVGSAEVLLTLVCQQLTADQRADINTILDEKLKAWKGNDIIEDIMDGAKHILNKKF